MLSEVTVHRRFLHQIPELGDDLPQTLTLVSGVLRGHRCDYFSPIPGSVCAWFDFGKEETTAFRADLDAQPVQESTGLPFTSRNPGRMHARGHDGQTAMALALSQWLAGNPAGLARNVLVIFQPASETGGAEHLRASGILEQYRVTRIFSLRLWPDLPEGVIASRPGPMMARSNAVAVSIRGKSARLSRAEEGNDALLAGMEYFQRARAMAEAVPPPCILRFGRMVSGTAGNTVSGETELEGTLRTYREETYRACREALERIGQETAAETGCQIEVRFSGGYPAVWNDEELYRNICTVLGNEAVRPLDGPVLAAEDFSFYQRRIPGVLFFLGIGGTAIPHSPEFDFRDEAVLPKGTAFLKQLALLP